MRFTDKEIKSIEATMDKLVSVAYTMWARESTDAVNARYISYIISEMRACAQLAESDNRTERLSGYDRFSDMIYREV